MSIKRVTVELDHGRVIDLSPWTGMEIHPESVMLANIYPKEWEVLTELLNVLQKSKGSFFNPNPRRVSDESSRQVEGDQGPGTRTCVDGAK